ncbi:MAG: hotdog fold thioesterase [Candidatus Lokiarchaeota archaeon]|nr:hotdog fold thioesterase [Candidatus Lokiarchaeota archaeon]
MQSGKVPAPPIAKLLGMQLRDVSKGCVVMEMEATKKHWNPMHTLHGGVMCDIADAAMGSAFFTTLDDDESYTTVDLHIKFLKPVITGKITASATVVKRGRRLGYIECEIRNDEGELVAKADSSCIVLREEN